MRNFFLFLILTSCVSLSALAQTRVLKGHSHNDYRQQIPFYTAYHHYFASIEADIFSVDGQLLVGHDRHELTPDRSFAKLYLEPILNIYDSLGNKAYSNVDGAFVLLLDLKTSYDSTLFQLVELLQDHREVFDAAAHPNAVRVVISGNSPSPEAFSLFPDFISFDGRPDQLYSASELARVAMISEDYTRFSEWDGLTTPNEHALERVKEFIDHAHRLNKKARLWGAPDTPLAWEVFQRLGMDYINTDQPEVFFNSFPVNE